MCLNIVHCIFSSGESVDITLHEVKINGQLKELHQSSTEGWGETSVNKAFKRVLAEITTEKMLNSYIEEYLEDYIKFLTNFEREKRNCKREKGPQSSITIAIPFSFIEECIKTLGTDLNTLINDSKFDEQISMKNHKIRMKFNFFQEFFRPACDGIIKYMNELFQCPKFKDVNKILMVGGFSESNILQDTIRNAFPNCQVIIPEEPGLAVLRGAVMFGFYPEAINSRVAKNTYGVDMGAKYDPAIHDESKKEVIDKVEYCTCLFDKLVEQGET